MGCHTPYQPETPISARGPLVCAIQILSFDISRYKSTSQASTWLCAVPTCNTFYISSNAVDRVEGTCTRTSVIGGSSPEKTVWWKVDLGDIYSIYSINILFKDLPGYEDRQRGRFAGFSLFISESGKRENHSLCYKDGPELPPLNFTTTCTGYGRYVIFYNERLDGVDYPDGYEIHTLTELCEVIVKGCNKSSYGRNCDRKCSVNCEDQRCNIVNGTCIRCTKGWKGSSCENKCPKGWYGLGCKQQCSGHCINNEVCNHATGRCDNGCADGWIGITCEESCKDGSYGPGCIYNCSGHCFDDVYCNKQTGHCGTGCKPGYTGSLCKTECTIGYFGNQCKEHCSHNCLNDEICNHIDGVCTNGCKDGYIGERCNKSISASDAVCSNKNHSAITIGFGVSLSVNLIFLAGIVFLFRRQMLQNFRTSNNSRPVGKFSQDTQVIEEVMENKNNYQQLMASTDNNEYQVIHTSDKNPSEPGNTYQNLALSTL
ncbi:multiple epidermal growth factor-like domains protein 6 [Saccostrea echinata]|uniref:multiple epidermal growth factor-like domains protein 6 n=1 Tax=Saccostrea echinata TaxID=191078 RepID=UPI002A82757A|nr:multiple epidermal growth factor-like domains protein 6 [Saccostrea echinata]